MTAERKYLIDGRPAQSPPSRLLLGNPHITNNAADDPVGNSRPPSIFMNPAGRGLQMGPRATESFRPPPFQRAVRPAPAASRLQPAPPIGLLVWIGEGVQNSSVFLHETDPCQVRPRRRRNVLSGRLTPQYLTQQLVEPPVVALTKQPLMLRVLADRQLCAAAAAAHWVRCEFAPRGPSPRHGRSTGHALFDFDRLFARIAHQKSPQALNTRKSLQRKYLRCSNERSKFAKCPPRCAEWDTGPRQT